MIGQPKKLGLWALSNIQVSSTRQFHYTTKQHYFHKNDHISLLYGSTGNLKHAIMPRTLWTKPKQMCLAFTKVRRFVTAKSGGRTDENRGCCIHSSVTRNCLGDSLNRLKGKMTNIKSSRGNTGETNEWRKGTLIPPYQHRDIQVHIGIKLPNHTLKPWESLRIEATGRAKSNLILH